MHYVRDRGKKRVSARVMGKIREFSERLAFLVVEDFGTIVVASICTVYRVQQQ